MKLWAAFTASFRQVWVDYWTPIAWLLSWAFYYLGDLAYRVLELLDDWEGWVMFWFPVYNWFMNRSAGCQDWAGYSWFNANRWWPWSGPEETTPE